MTSPIVGNFKLSKSENFDEFLKELGVGMIKRKLANSTSPTIEIKQDGDTYTVATKTAIKNSEIKFKLNEEFEEQRQDDVTVKSIVKQEGNKWIQTQTPPDGNKVVTIEREFSDDGIKTTATVNGVTSVRVYDRVK